MFKFIKLLILLSFLSACNDSSENSSPSLSDIVGGWNLNEDAGWFIIIEEDGNSVFYDYDVYSEYDAETGEETPYGCYEHSNFVITDLGGGMFESLSESGDYSTLKLSISGSTMIWSDPEGEGESMIFTLIDEVQSEYTPLCEDGVLL